MRLPEALNPKRRKRAKRSSLTPSDETVIELKGGFLLLDGESDGTFEPTRAEDIYELGFT